MDRRPELRRSMTLSQQLSTPNQAIRDFLKIPNDDSHLDADRTAADSSGGMWKPLRDRLRLRRAANAWSAPSQKSATTSSDSGTTGNLKNNNNRSNKYIYAPGEATAAFSRTTSLRQTPTFSRATSTRVGATATIGRMDRAPAVDHDDDEASEEESEHDEDDDEEEKDEDEAPAAQMSLMALLGQSDNTWDEDDEDEEGDGGAGRDGASKGAAHGDDDEDDGDGEGREEEMVHVCCVCMVRHKGAAFIPCGHTFCRLCSRELWVSRGNCPLCNGFIQEILDIF